MDIADVDNLNFNLNVLEEQDDGNAPDVSHLMEGFDGEELSLFCDAITSEEVFDNIPLIETENTNLSTPLEDTLIEQESLISSDYSIHNSSISHTPTPSKIGSSSYTKNSSKGLHLLYLTSSGQQPTQIPDNPEDQAELIASNATIALRQSGLAFMEQESGTINTIDEFRSAFYGSNGGEYGVDMMGSDDEGGYGNDSDNETGKNKKRKKGKRPHNPDSDLIEAATEEQLLVLNIDPIGKEGKKQRRRIRNRMSAQLHRERKKLYIDALEAFVKLKDAKIRQLESDVAKLAQENRMLKQCQAPLLPTALSGGLDVEEQEVTREAQGSSITGSTTSVTGSMTDGTDGHSEASMSPVHVGLPDVDIEYGDTQNDGEMKDSIISSNTNTRTRKRARASSGKGASGSTGILVAKGFGSVLPFLSVICVLCLTYYQTGVDLGLGGMMSFPSSSSLSNVDSAYETMSMMDFNDNDQSSRHRVLLELPLPPTTGTDGNDGEKALISSSHHQSDRPLHSYSLSSISNTFDKHHVYSYPNTNQDSDSNRRALWSYPSQHLMMTLYPRYKEVSVNRTSKSVYTDINTTWTEPVVKRHLRVRSQGNLKKSTVPPFKAIVPQPQSSVSTKSLVPATVSAIHTTHGNEVVSVRSSARVTDEGVPQVAVSRVLMEDGQALLDPKMTEVITVQAKGSARETHKSSTGSYSPHYAIDMGPGSSSYASSRSSSDNMISSDNNVLFMLVPASSVRWGNTWKDSYSSTTESLLQHLQNQKQENETVSDSSNGDGELYIELGCSIFKAQLVRDVEALQGKMS